MNCLENRLKDKVIKELENKPELFEFYLTALRIRQSILERDSEVKTFIPNC